jgi:hypothetical protein
VATNAQNGCSSSKTIQVGEPELPSGAVWTLQQVSCYGYDNGSIRIDSVRNGAAPFQYAVDVAPFSPYNSFGKLLPGNHALRILSADGCLWDTTFTVVQPNELLLDLGPDTSVHLGEMASLWRDINLNEPQRKAQLWSNPSILAPALCDTCLYEARETFRYAVTVLDSNGCRASDEREIIVSKGRKVYAPNVFAPETTGANARFTLFGGPDVASVRWLRIFDRWGQQVFENMDFLADDMSAGWNGKNQSQEVAPGVFVWQAEILFKDGLSEIWTGDVTVLR